MTDKGTGLCAVTLGVEGMTCASCVQSIEQRIGSLEGVMDVKVDAGIRRTFTLISYPKLKLSTF